MTIEKSLPNMVMVCVDGAITSEETKNSRKYGGYVLYCLKL